MIAAEARVPKSRLIVAAAALFVGATILLLTRTFNFYFDEWDFILAAPDWTPVSYLQPHNEHPAMIPRLVYAVLLGTAGLRSYVPYMALLLAVHGLNAVLLFENVRRRAGDVVGVTAAAMLLVLGAGWENILWAFQMTFAGSVAFGLAALLVLQRPPSRWGSLLVLVLTTGSIMCSGIGLFFTLAVAACLAASPGRRRELLWLTPIAAAMVVWYLTWGRTGAESNPPAAASNIVLVPLYAAWGIGEAVAGIIGEGGAVGPLALIAAIAAVAWTWARHRPDGFALGVAAGLVGMYVITGLSRAQFGYQQSGAGRYVYEGSIFWLLLLGDAARHLPWRGTWRPALIACAFLACFNSGALLFEFAAAKTQQMRIEAADLQALDAVRHDHCLYPDGLVDPLVMPQVRGVTAYYRAVDAYGDPAPPPPVTDQAAFDRARPNLLLSGCS